MTKTTATARTIAEAGTVFGVPMRAIALRPLKVRPITLPGRAVRRLAVRPLAS